MSSWRRRILTESAASFFFMDANYLLKWYVVDRTLIWYKDVQNVINYSYLRKLRPFPANGIAFILIDLSSNEIIDEKDALKVIAADLTLPRRILWQNIF